MSDLERDDPQQDEHIEAQKAALDQEQPPSVGGADYAPSVAARFELLQRAGGAVIPVVTTIFAFLMGMIVIAATGHNPFTAFKGIFNGTGLNWFFPWVLGDERTNAAFNLQQTLILTATLILTGLAVSFAFKCGLFNIGGNGQYISGALVSTWVGSSWVQMSSGLHIFLAVVLAALAGAFLAAIAGFLKATVGAHEVITTIMLNLVASYVAQALVGRGGQLQNHVDTSNPVSSDIAQKAHLPVFWGDPVLQGLHVGFFIALAMPVVFWLILNRTTLGYEVRATGFNPEAARYGGVNVKRSYIAAMAVSGSFAGLAGAIDILGWQFRLGVLDIQIVNLGFTGIAVALLGRNSALGVALAALLFGALTQGTSTRNPAIADIIDPRLAGNLSIIIQGLVLLFVGADLLFLYLWGARKKLRAALPWDQSGGSFRGSPPSPPISTEP
jgi:general nucleoside transport system permease protein